MKRYASSGLSSVPGVAVNLIMLALTFAIALFMVTAGLITMTILRHRLRKEGGIAGWQKTSGPCVYQLAGLNGRESIDGSCIEVEKLRGGLNCLFTACLVVCCDLAGPHELPVYIARNYAPNCNCYACTADTL